MKLLNSVSEKRQKLIDEFESSQIDVNEKIYIKSKTYSKNDVLCRVVSKTDDGKSFIVIPDNDSTLKKQNIVITKDDITGRYNKFKIGADPFIVKGGRIRPKNYSFDSIIFEFDLVEPRHNEKYVFDGVICRRINWNPFVYDKDGQKLYYQRDFCWTLKDKQNLIESIYNGINIGMVLVRNRGWHEIENMRKNHNETDLAFKDIIDGKQRLNTIGEFLNNKFQDSHGNYFNDLSAFAQNKFTDHQLMQYAEMPEHTLDEDVLYQFLKLNFAGVPQSTEHIKYVKSLLKTI